MSETEPDVVAQLERLHGPQELSNAVLALVLPPGSRRAIRAWRLECGTYVGAQDRRDAIAQLPANARLPWFETLVTRMRNHPLAERQALLAATRRVMSARGIQRPIDRLHWLVMRQRLGEATHSPRAAAATELSLLPESDVNAIASYSAFLARMIPLEPAELEDPGPTEGGLAWYATVMKPWERNAIVPPCEPPDTARLVSALQELQAIAWMQRPALVRNWVSAAKAHSPHGRLTDTSADALRLSCALLDSPRPPELSRHYGETEAAL